jgi:hypothetical protein
MTERDEQGRNPSLTDRHLGVDDDDTNEASGPAVGRSDADADAERSGADLGVGTSDQHDSEGEPVGRDDLDEDIRRSGAEPEDA